MAKFDPFLSLDFARVEGNLAIAAEQSMIGVFIVMHSTLLQIV